MIRRDINYKAIVKNDNITINYIKSNYLHVTPGKTYDIILSHGGYYFLIDDYGFKRHIEMYIFKTIETHRKEILNELGI